MNTVEKSCMKCGIVKPISEFYVHPAMGDGRLNKCKVCTKADVAANYRANIEYYKQYEKSRANLPHRVDARKSYAATPGGKQALRRGGRNYAARYPLKKAATTAVNNAVRDGRLQKRPCEMCGAQIAHAHHDDYSKPLDVRWLCVAHHLEWHRHNKAKYPQQDVAA